MPPADRAVTPVASGGADLSHSTPTSCPGRRKGSLSHPLPMIGHMKILVSTTETQGAEEGDFFWGTVGEIVQFPTFVCHAYPSACGCDRAWSGIDSSQATTSAIVAEIDLTRGEVVRLLQEALVRSGWVNEDSDPDESLAWARQNASEVLAVADRYEVGTVLGVHTLATDNDDHEGTLPREVIVRRIGASKV